MYCRSQGMPDVIFKEWNYKRGPGYLFGREVDGVNEDEQQIAKAFLEKFLLNGKTKDPKILQNMFGPSIWTAPTLHTAELLSTGKSSPTFLYYYTHPGTLSLSDLLSFPLWKLLLKLSASKLNIDLFPNTQNCSTHFDEIFLMFKGRNIPFLQRYTPSDKLISDTLLKLWTNFAKTYPPVISSLDQKIVWEPFHAHKNRKHLVISLDALNMQDLSVFDDILDFFQSVYKVVPPSLHLWRSPSWRDPSLYAKYYPDSGHVEL